MFFARIRLANRKPFHRFRQGDVMPSPMTLPVDKETRQRIARIARRKRVSASEVIRQAIEAWIEEQEPAGSPYEMVSDLIGIVHGGNRKRSAGAGRQFAALLKSRRGSR